MNPYKSYTDQNLIWNINFNRKFFRIKQPSLKKVAMSKYPQEPVELYLHDNNWFKDQQFDLSILDSQ